MRPKINKKMRKGFSIAFLFMAMVLAPKGAEAMGQSEVVVVEQPASDAETPKHELPIEKTAGDFEESWEGENSSWIKEEPDAFTSDYGESKIARRMTQAEKNRNAAENDGWGGAITIIAMCIVISALVVLSILFMIFGKISKALLTSKKKKAKAAADHPHDDDNHELAPGEVIAAISMALMQHFNNKHDIEDTHLTIRRLQKAYSPWNSKIYNLRHMQDHRRNSSTEINYNESKRIQI